MKDLPVPAFVTYEDQLDGATAITNAGDTTTDKVSSAVSLGHMLMDNHFVYARYLKKEGDLLYHIFRGDGVPQEFWGRGDFGLLVLEAAEVEWPTDKPLVEFHSEVVRPEAENDDPTEPSVYPTCYYGAYLVTIPNVDARPLPPDEHRFKRMLSSLHDALVQASESWSNGS